MGVVSGVPWVGWSVRYAERGHWCKFYIGDSAKTALQWYRNVLYFVMVIRETILWLLERKCVKVLLSLEYPFNKVEFTKE